MVNISGDCEVEEQESLTKIKPTIFKEYRAGMGEFSETKNENETSTISMMLLKANSPWSKHMKRHSQEDYTVNYED